jgi:type II secretory pathway pseudopilin PulG
MSKTRRSNLLSKKVIIVVAILAVGAVSVILVASTIAQTTTAQQQQQYRQRMMMGMMGWSDEAIIIPQINGSVSLTNETSNFINENVKVPFVEAAQTAQGQLANGTVLGGHLGMVQGYLVYKFFVVENNTNQAGHLTVIDAGNGDVLYTSEGQPIGSFGHSSIFGPWSGGGGYGHERGWGGPWKGHWMREWQ